MIRLTYMDKIVRSVCYFNDHPDITTLDKVNKIARKLAEKGFILQTKRICSANIEKIIDLDNQYSKEFLFGIGEVKKEELHKLLPQLLNTNNISFNLDLTRKEIDLSDVNILFEIVRNKPSYTFNFTYVFNNKPSTPYFPSAVYEKNGFSIGLQPTDLAENVKKLNEWFKLMKSVWDEIFNLFKNNSDFLGIDSSIAPIFTGKGSLVNFVKKLGFDFSHSTTTSIYLKTTNFIKKENPKPIGLCGLMFPCLEDFELADEYEKGNFSLERNVYLSLHSGVGIDTYPIGIDESMQRVVEVLKLIQGLSNKYNKPLSCRFISDGKAKIGDKTDFKNQYLKDVAIRQI